MNINVIERHFRDYERIQRIKLQKNMISIAWLWINHRNNVKNLKKKGEECAKFQGKIAQQEKEVRLLEDMQKHFQIDSK